MRLFTQYSILGVIIITVYFLILTGCGGGGTDKSPVGKATASSSSPSSSPSSSSSSSSSPSSSPTPSPSSSTSAIQSEAEIERMQDGGMGGTATIGPSPEPCLNEPQVTPNPGATPESSK